MADASADLNIIMRARDEATKAMQAIQKELRAIDRAADAMTPGVDKAAGSMKRLGDNTKHGHDSMKGMDQMMAGMSMTMLGLPLVAVAGQAMKLSAEFETLSNVAQVNARATDEQKRQFEKLALQLGKDTVFSAGQAMAAINELSKSGLSVENIMSAMPGTLSMAAAGNLEVAAAAEIASNAMNAFKLSGQDMNRVADLLAATANASSAEVFDLADSFKMSSAVFSAAGFNIEELAASLGLLANMGIKGSDAGTSLKQMILSLQNPSKEAKGMMRELGVSVYDTEGNMRDLKDIIEQFSAALVIGNETISTGTVKTKEMGKEFKNAEKDIAAAAKQAETLTEKLGPLNDKIAIQQREIQRATLDYNALAATYGTASKQAQTKAIALDKLKLAMSQNQAQLAKYKAEIVSANGKMTEATGNLGKYKAAGEETVTTVNRMTQAKRDEMLSTIFGSDAVRAANVVLAGGIEQYDQMYEAVTRAGAAQEVAEARMKGLSGAIEYFKGSLETFMIQGGLPFNDTLAKTIRLAADLISAIGELPAPLQRVLAVTVAATGGLLVVGGTLLGIVGSINMMMPALKPVVDVMGRLRDVAGSVIDRVRGEAKALGDVTDACRGAEDGKNKVTEANANLHTAAVKSTKALGDEVGMLDKLRDAYGRFAADHQVKLSGININTGQVGGGAMEGIGKMLGGVLAGAIGAAIGSIGVASILSGLGTLGGAMAGAIGAAIGSIGVASILSGLGTALAGVASAAGAVLASPALLIGLAIAAIIASAIVYYHVMKRAFEDWLKSFELFKTEMKKWGGAIAKALADGLKNALGAAVSAKKLMTWFNLGRLIGLIAGLFIYGAPVLRQAIEKMLGPIPEWLRTNIARWKDQLLASFTELVSLTTTKLSELRNEVIRRFSDAWDWIAANVPTWPGKIAAWLGEIADKGRDLMGQVKDYMVGRLSEAWDWIAANVPAWPGKIAGWLGEIADRARESLGQAKDYITGKLEEAWDWIVANVPTWPGKVAGWLGEIADKGRELMGQVKDHIVGRLSEAWDWIATNVPTWPGKIRGFLSDLASQMRQIFEDAKDQAIEKLGEAWDWIEENVPTWPAKIAAFLKELSAKIQAIFRQAKDWALAKLEELWQWITTELPQWPGRIASFLSGIPAAVQQVFEDAKQLAAAKLQEFIDVAGRLAKDIAEAIMSPLRAMIDEVKKIFEEILAGIRQGLEDARKLLPGGDTSSSSSQSATTEKSGSTQSVAVNKSSSTQGSTQSSGTTNNYGNNYGDTIVVQSKSTASMIVNSKRDARIRQLVEAF